MPLHPDPWIALAWLVALVVGAVLGVRDGMARMKHKRFRFNAKGRAVLRAHSNAQEQLVDRETKLPPIL